MFRNVILVLAFGVSVSAAQAQKLYWTDDTKAGIQRASLDSLDVEPVVTTGGARVIGLALDAPAGKVYWTTWDKEAGGRKIQRANLDGSKIEDLVTKDVDGVAGIAIDPSAKKMYWVDFQAKKIRRANLHIKKGEKPDRRSDIEDVVTTGLDNPLFITLDLQAKKMYWTDRGKIQRANLDGSNVEKLVEGQGKLRGIALDTSAGKMYWANMYTGKIQRADMDGTKVEDIVVLGQDGPCGIALNLKEGKMYWADNLCCTERRGQILRADLDGSNTEIVIPRGTIVPYSIALDIDSPPGR